MIEFFFAEASSRNDPTRVHAAPRHQAERKCTDYCGMDGSTHQGQLPAEMSALSTLPPDILDRLHRIADPETLTTLESCLRAKRRSPSNNEPGGPLKTPDPSDTSIAGQLSWYQFQYENRGTSNEQFPEVPRRLFLANIAGLYLQETSARREGACRKKRRKTKKDADQEATNRSLNDIFVDIFLPQLRQKEGDTRKEGKRRFENWLRLGTPCAKLVESFGSGILLLLPRDLSNEK